VPRREPSRGKLTPSTVRSLEPRPGRAYLRWDTLQRGLAVQVQPTGHKSWFCIYRHQGRPRWYHLGAVDALGLADARRLAAKIMLQVLEGRDPAAERKAARGAGTFAEMHARYLEEWSKKRNKSWRQGDALVRKYLLPRWGKLTPKGITRADVRTMMSRIEAPVLANQVLAAASAVFTWAVAQEIVPFNPCRGVERNETRNRERKLSDLEIPRFWQACDDIAGLVAGSALKVLLLTGQRPGEVSHMRREHISDGWWTMPGEPDAAGWPGTKNKQTHTVWLPKAAQDIINYLNEDEPSVGFVFELGISRLGVAMRSICKAVGMEPARPHDLRRTHGTAITKLGFGRDAMNRIQNHREGGITDVYDQHEYMDENKQVMEAVAQHILKLTVKSSA
jgi:integrase